jgi:hypothetical protein
MKRAMIVLVIILLVAGFVRGWIAVSAPHREKEGNKVEVNFTVDPQQIKDDAKEVKESAEKLEEKVREEFQDATHNADATEKSEASGKSEAPESSPDSE